MTPTTLLTVRSYVETNAKKDGYRLVREWLDSDGHVVRFEVVRTWRGSGVTK